MHHDEPDLGVVDPPSRRLDRSRRTESGHGGNRSDHETTDLGENRCLGSGRPPPEVRRVDLAPLLEAKQTPHDQDGGPASRESRRQAPALQPAKAASQVPPPPPTTLAGTPRPQGADPATPRADPDEAGRGRLPAPWMRKTIRESRQGEGGEKERGGASPSPSLRPHGRRTTGQAAARGGGSGARRWVAAGGLGSAHVTPRGATRGPPHRNITCTASTFNKVIQYRNATVRKKFRVDIFERICTFYLFHLKVRFCSLKKRLYFFVFLRGTAAGKLPA
jgi:hypothetical protein